MPAQTSLLAFSEPDLETPEGRIQDLVSNPVDPTAYDSPLGELFLEYRKPIGFDDVCECTDADLIREYRTLCREHLPGDYFAENPMVRKAAEDKYYHLDKLDAYINYLEFPDPSEWLVEPEFINWVLQLDTPSRGSFMFDRQGWERVWDSCRTSELQFIKQACRIHYGSPTSMSSTIDDILAGFLYYRGETELDEIITVSNRGVGPSEGTILTNLDVTLSRLDPVIGAHLLNWMHSEITRNRSESGSGRYTKYNRKLNISSDGDINRAIENEWLNNSVAHEAAHALHDMYGFFVGGGDTTDNRNIDPENWDWDVEHRPHDSTSTPQDAFRACIRQEWEKLRSGEVDALETYQTKNASELITSAFECWIVNPEKLSATQPRMKTLFEAHFGPQNYSRKQRRLEQLPSPNATRSESSTFV